MIRVRVITALGSTPRDAGAEMFVGADRVDGTIGGGQLEYMAIDRARQMLALGEAEARMDIPLGPEIGQCCGGRVVLHLDRNGPTPEDHPDALVFGAGHVGRALALALHPLPVNATLIDQRPEELALAAPGIATRLTALPEAEIRAAPPGSAIVILTHDHALDFLLAAEALARSDLSYVGMIGSATKRAQFSRFARDRGIDPAPLVCPIGAGFSPDKRPAVIAAFAAAELIARLTAASSLKKHPCNS
ncbi:xanthine dehydrogenase accessory protein XdhC [Paracoccus sediminis]|uniref:Molybdenum cofactor sulfurylase n=1 Tax=Paracoccus sediminis TaxID=1214787 RepID=A0A238XYV9_9RHOB|nr:xanthine dehydrogenase accessory protein XdhC [Paracoccus sediminis]TBN47535.1 xanthine dehydrogenase accessory protein XdhC [Paracoccus sediminis]SNR63544.1 molybdenum cofactor sulfurylase [Paracoccus sediminis]